jgi:anhydro-N-acetylmuramic acid kinase
MPVKYLTVVGMMSGTSLDGIDLVLCRFTNSHGQYRFRILHAVTYIYTPEWRKQLNAASALGAEEFLLLHHEYGKFIGDQVNRFLNESGHTADLIASHGHTIFHQPSRGFTFQLGDGASIASRCHITTVSDFRNLDVALGGQGAPLVPAGDEILFPEYSFCLNLGGFANISNQLNGIRIASDLCPVNIVLNSLARSSGHEFDEGGETGRRGTANASLLNELNSLEFYSRTGPKSLGREWVESCFMPLLLKYDLPQEDLARTVYEHIAFQIGRYVNFYGPGDMMVTGGGTFNTFLVEKIAEATNTKLVVPDDQIIMFKEALIFAFLGLLRYRNKINCLASVTGARRDSSSGIIHLIS